MKTMRAGNRVSDSNPSSQRAFDVLSAAVAAGVEHVIVCPGSRSQALALAAAHLERTGRIRLHVRTDERSAAFLALGIAMQSGRPAAVITTSGSAVANLLPAVVEAHHAGIPLLLLTADRPEGFRGRRANQTTRHDQLLAAFVREYIEVEPAVLQSGAIVNPVDITRAVAIARGLEASEHSPAGPGPVQVNLQFAEPLSGPAQMQDVQPVTAELSDTGAPQPVRIGTGPHTLVVAGTGAGSGAEACATALDAPLIAEVASGAHFGPNLVVAYRQLLRLPEFVDTVERVIVFGTPTLSREVAQLCTSVPELIVVDSPGADRYLPIGRDSAAVTVAAAVETDETANAELSEWRDIWVAASRKLLAELDSSTPVGVSGVAYGGHVEDFAAQREYVNAELAAIRAEVTRERLVEAVWAATWPHDRLLFGASRLIRVADSVLPGKNIPVFANRGQSGIDGTIATGFGLAVATERGVTRVVLGDLAALHDAGSLRLTPGEPLPALQVIIGNDRGGTIFSGLEVAGSAEPNDFERVQLTPHDVDFAALANAYGWDYRRAETVGALDQALTQASERPVLIEVPLER